MIEEVEAPGLLASTTCKGLFDCACPERPFDDREECLGVLQQRGEDMASVAGSAGLVYDGACVSRLATVRHEIGCDVVEDAPRCIACKPYVGDGAQGQPCDKLGVTVDLDTCAQGLRCVDRTCVPLCDAVPILGVGEPCRSGIEVFGTCEPGLHCDAETQRCEISPALGESCPDRTCAVEAWCDLAAEPDPTCAERLPSGEACFLDEACESGRCEEGRCSELVPSVCALD